MGINRIHMGGQFREWENACECPETGEFLLRREGKKTVHLDQGQMGGGEPWGGDGLSGKIMKDLWVT